MTKAEAQRLVKALSANFRCDINYAAFRNTALKSVKIPKTVEKIDSDAFPNDCAIIKEG